MSALTHSVDAGESAIAAALENEEFANALELIAADWPCLSALRGTTLRSAIERIPEREWGHNAWIIAALGASYRSLDSSSPSAALPHFQAAEHLIACGVSPAVDLPAIQLQHAASLRGLGMLESARAKAESARILLQGDLDLAFPRRLALQSQAALQLGLIELHLGNLAEAATQLRLAAGLGEHGLVPSEQVECLTGLAFTSYALGDFDQAERLLWKARAAADDSALLESRFGAGALAVEMLIAVNRNEAVAARALEGRLIKAARHSEWEPLAFYARAATAGISGQLIEALDLQRHASAAARDWEGTPAIRLMAEILRGRIHLYLGQPDIAMSLLAATSPDRDHSNCPATMVASIRLSSSDFAGCLETLDACHRLGDLHSVRTLADVLTLTAAANYELRRQVAGDVAFDRALYLGSQTGQRVPFHTIPRPTLLRMLDRATDRYQPDAIHRLLDELRLGSEFSDEVVEPLSDRERDIAQHLFEDKTVNQIAAELFISANTVKTHVRSIYRKLSASSRQEAAKRVQELGLDIKITLR